MYQRLLFLAMILGVIGVLIFGYYALMDWHALQVTYRQFEHASQTTHDLSTLFIAESQQNIHRINLFADGVWTLLSAILAAIGVHGLYIGDSRLK